MGESKIIEEIKVVWTDGKVQTLTNLNVNQTIVLKQTDARSIENEFRNESRLFATENTGIFPEHRPEENMYDDFAKQVLLPHKMSSFGLRLPLAI